MFKMPHFTYEEAVQAIRLRVEDAGYRLEELLPQDVLTAIYAMSPAPREVDVQAEVAYLRDEWRLLRGLWIDKRDRRIPPASIFNV